MPGILLTGVPGVGKSTLLVELMRAHPGRLAGFVTEEERENAQRVGFRVRTIPGGTVAMLAHKRWTDKSFRVGSYGVDEHVVESILVPMIEVVVEKRRPLVIDEIGKMQVRSARFCDAVRAAFEAGIPIVATVPLDQDTFVRSIVQRRDVRLFTLTDGNRLAMRGVIAQCLQDLLPAP